ncbi:MAG: 50S ribosomal protein L5 [Candidatus Nanoarchaeia archaeon]|nr:50S ribosomal protein L5 [Candidatus Nanoarchaeia archaeon]
MNKENKMRSLRISKVTLNIGMGEAGEKLQKAKKLLETIAGVKAVITKSNKRIPSWGVRPGLEIGTKCTLRGEPALVVLKKMLEAKEFILDERNFDNNGNLSFGIKEYIDIPGAEYDPSLGVIGMDVCVTIERQGYRVKKRKIRSKTLPRKHIVKKEESIEFISKLFDVKIKTQAKGETQ